MSWLRRMRMDERLSRVAEIERNVQFWREKCDRQAVEMGRYRRLVSCLVRQLGGSAVIFDIDFAMARRYEVRRLDEAVFLFLPTEAPDAEKPSADAKPADAEAK